MRLLSSVAVLLSILPHVALASELRVVTDIAPVHSLVSKVMAGVAEPILLVDQGADAHHFSLRPSQARALQNADLLVWIGPEMTPWLGTVLEGLGQGKPALGLLADQGTMRRSFGEEDAEEAHEHDHDHDHDHDHGAHDHEEHSHEGTDPHAWLDPANAVAWLGLIAEDLAMRDGQNAQTYRENAKAAQAELLALDAQIAAQLAPMAGRPFVLAHDALGYFTAHYGLQSAGAVADGDARAPGAARLRSLREQMKADGVVCAFPEAGRDDALLKLVVEGSTVRLGAPLDPEGRAAAIGPELYPQMLRNLATGIADCLGQ